MSKQHVAQCTIDLAQHRGNRSRVPYTGKFSWARIFTDRWFRVFHGKYFRGLNTSTVKETSIHFTQSTSTRRLGTILGHFSRIATKTPNPRKFSTAKISRYTVLFNPLPTNDAYICVMGVLTSSIRLYRINLYGRLTLDANTLYLYYT